jgi:hypothetical protein
MRQQINLYQPIFSEGRRPLSSRTFGIALGLVVAALAGYSFYANAQLSKLAAAVEAARVQQTQEMQLLEAAGEASANREKPETVQGRVSVLESTIAARRIALGVLESGAAGQTSGFAARMEALARSHVDGLWIDKLMLSGTNGSMSLGGATLDADTVPVYLHSLAQESVLRGIRFDEFVIERPTAKAKESVVDAGDAEEVAKPKKQTAPAHIRFRAGSKALAPVATDAETAT